MRRGKAPPTSVRNVSIPPIAAQTRVDPTTLPANANSSSGAFPWKLVLISVGVLAVYLLFRKLQRSASRTKIEKQVRERCGAVESSDTIFVAMYAYKDGRVAETIVDLFHKAVCPRRIVVGIYQHIGRGDTHCMERYQSMAKYYGHPVYSDNVRVLTGVAHDAKGRSWPLAMIFRALYQGEKYSLILDTNARLCHDWDEKMIAHYFKSVEVNGGNPHVALTQTPPTRTALSIVSGIHGPPTFTRMNQWKDQHLPLPVFEMVTCKNTPLRPMATFYADLSFLFAPSSMFHQVSFDPRLYFVDKQDLDWLLMIRYWTHGWSMFTPPELICVKMPTATGSRSGSDIADRPPALKQHLREFSYHAIYAMIGVEKWPETSGVCKAFGTARSVQSYMDVTGINFLKRTVTDAALLGLWHAEWLKNLADEEIISKYGSWSDAIYTRERIRAQWLGTEEQPYLPTSMDYMSNGAADS